MLIEFNEIIVDVENSDIKLFESIKKKERKNKLGHLLKSSGSPANLDPIIKVTKVTVNVIASQFFTQCHKSFLF